MDSALTFGILLAMLAYFRGEESWGPPLFYGGVAVAVLGKSLPGFLPLFLAPLHALLAGNFHLPWKTQARPWLYWSPLVLLPLLWWGYLVAQYGDGVFSAYFDDLLSIDAGQPVDTAGRLYRFFQVYFYDFGRKYLPWIFFTMIGLKTLFRTALNSNTERPKRAHAKLLLGWIVVVLIAGGLKPSQYVHYLMPALPAIAIVTAVAVVQRLKDRVPTWAPGSIAILTVISGAGVLREPLFLSRTISGLVVSMAYLYSSELHFRTRPFRNLLRKRNKPEESLQSTRHGVTTAQTD
jgi:hypothetical protein